MDENISVCAHSQPTALSECIIIEANVFSEGLVGREEGMKQFCFIGWND